MVWDFIHLHPFKMTIIAQHQLPAALIPVFSGLSICCSSPERFLRLDRGSVLEARPIKVVLITA